MRNAVIVFTLFLVQGLGLAVPVEKQMVLKGFWQRVIRHRRGNHLTLLRLQENSNLSWLMYQQRKWQLGRHPRGGPIPKKIPWKNSWSGFLVNGLHRAVRSGSNGVSARVLLLDPTVPLLRMPT